MFISLYLNLTPQIFFFAVITLKLPTIVDRVQIIDKLIKITRFLGYSTLVSSFTYFHKKIGISLQKVAEADDTGIRIIYQKVLGLIVK